MPILQANPPRKAPFQSQFTAYRDNAEEHVPVFVDVHSPDRDEQVRRAAIAVCPFLYNNHHDDDDVEEEPVVAVTKDRRRDLLTVKPLCGGLSNELYIVSSTTNSVLVRIHPNNNDDGFSVVDREVENRLVAWLSRKRMAPIYYGRFENGRVEEFYPNVTPLQCHEMKDYAPQIAQAMAEFHTLDAASAILPQPTSSHAASVYETCDKWLAACQASAEENPQSSSSSSQEEDNDNLAFLEQLESEWKWLFHELQTTSSRGASYDTPIQAQALHFIRQVVVTHMDCQSLNILKDSMTTTAAAAKENDQTIIRLIDFEYAGWNPRAADIANTFCEYCDMNNLCADYEREYPSRSQQNDYLLSYVRHADSHLAAQLTEAQQWEPFLDTLRAEVGRFSALSHLVWSIWSVVKSRESSNIDFDYTVYARHRMDGYHFAKQQFFHKK